MSYRHECSHITRHSLAIDHVIDHLDYSDFGGLDYAFLGIENEPFLSGNLHEPQKVPVETCDRWIFA